MVTAISLPRLVSLIYLITNCVVVNAQLFSAPGEAEAHSFGLPTYHEFAVKSVFRGQPARPILDTPAKRLYATVIRHEAASGPNFAGHYTVVQSGCGTECIRAVIVDSVSGEVLLPPLPFAQVERGNIPVLGYLAAMEDGGLSFNLKSSLLVIQGCSSAKDCGTYYYNLRDRKFALLETVHVCRDDYGEKESQCGRFYYKHFPDRWLLKVQAAKGPR